MHLRLLSEVGLLGYFAVIVVPLVVMVLSLQLAYRHGARDTHNPIWAKKTGLVLFSAILSFFFVREAFEDSYLVRVLGFETIFALFLFACVFMFAEKLGSATTGSGAEGPSQDEGLHSHPPLSDYLSPRFCICRVPHDCDLA
ncbi:hypothetical protein BBH56_08305 [Spiribacter roseus]|nr:hypothetical protein BBH56_08305 [Spiribacter roseus]